MKKIFNVLLLLFFFTNCEKVVEIDVPSSDAKLIIDAAFEVFFDASPVTANTVVRLRLSADYFDESIPTVTDANVYLTDLEDNSIIRFEDPDADGDYTPETPFLPANDTTYELTVEYNNETYKGLAQRVKSTPLTSVIQGDETLFSGEETELEVVFSDNGDEENFYLFDFSNAIFVTIEDRFFNGADYNFSFFYEEDEIEVPSTVTIKMTGISKEYFTYFRVLDEQSGGGAGGPFETIPATLLGNMINTTNADNAPLGYFHIGETDTVTVDLIDLNN